MRQEQAEKYRQNLRQIAGIILLDGNESMTK